MLQHTTSSTFFPYTTLFRSSGLDVRPPRDADVGRDVAPLGVVAGIVRVIGAVLRHDPGIADDPGLEHVARLPLRTRSDTRETARSEEHTSELQSRENLVCRL